MFLKSKLFRKAITLTVISAAVVLVGCGGELVIEVTPMNGGAVSLDIGQESHNNKVLNIYAAVLTAVSRDFGQERYLNGTNVTLTARPAHGYLFKEWTGAVSGNARTINIVISGNMNVRAIFEPLPTFTDSRDGKIYRYVTIGNQIWMAENLNFATRSGSWCSDDNESNCNTYGRLYNWNTARTVCPAGWHLPNNNEWKELINFAGGESIAGRRLKTRSGSGVILSLNEFGYNTRMERVGGSSGTDDFGFSALSGGYRRMNNDGFYGVNNLGFWWTSTESNASNAYYLIMNADTARVSGGGLGKPHGLSVRCVQSFVDGICGQ